MSTEAKLEPKTLEAARLAQGLSLAALAQRCGISAPTLSRLESGKREATEYELHTLAQALGIPARALSRALVTERLGLSAFYHRKLNRAGAKTVRSIENRCLLDAAALRGLFDMVDVPAERPIPSIDLEDAKGDPELAAHLVRLQWQVPRGPIPNLLALVESAGCVVIHSNFAEDDVDALYQKAAGLPPIFWVNSSKPLDRVRFSIAHELGHLILHEERPIDHARAEAEADTFAAAFLMPKSDFRGECPSRLGIEQLVQLKQRWRSSMQAIIRRARDVSRITDSQYTNLMIGMSKRKWRKTEPYPITTESPSLLARAIAACVEQTALTESDLADHLAIPMEQLTAWREPFPGGRPDPSVDTPKLRLACGY